MVQTAQFPTPFSYVPLLKVALIKIEQTERLKYRCIPVWLIGSHPRLQLATNWRSTGPKEPFADSERAYNRLCSLASRMLVVMRQVSFFGTKHLRFIVLASHGF
jgi:hypothetical protein